eukprot:67506-Chlamydomonas_euryale.AAC.7
MAARGQCSIVCMASLGLASMTWQRQWTRNHRHKGSTLYVAYRSHDKRCFHAVGRYCSDMHATC